MRCVHLFGTQIMLQSVTQKYNLLTKDVTLVHNPKHYMVVMLSANSVFTNCKSKSLQI